MTNEEFIALIGPYLEGELPEETKNAIEKQILKDRDFAWEVETLRLTRNKLQEGAEEIIASDAFRSRVLRRLYADNLHVTQIETETEEKITAEARQIRLF
jgi:anti-sigma-K factor RskA